MGLLDDAIREHLELKRRHGASSDEVEQQEREALGTARGGGEFARPDEGEPAPRDRDDEVMPDDELAAADDDIRPEAAAAPGYDEDPWLEEERDEVPAEESLERPAESAEEGEDVLEETPDFLQETPEHDRLWFEQRPPRDFDWDK